MKSPSLRSAGFRLDGSTPYSTTFDDVYFSRQGGIDEARHVFLGGNQLPERWRGRERFVIGELGFGTGLNLLVTWQAWRETRSPQARLRYVAIEGYPLSRDELTATLAQHHQLESQAQALLRVYPERAPGFHRLHLPDNISLTLLFGEVGEVLPQLHAQVDAWFLDGFAPSRNPEMWSLEVAQQLARLTANGGSIATYTAAGEVRRTLEQTGFSVIKKAGFGTKREMSCARVRATATRPQDKPWYRPPDAIRDTDRSAVVIGAGIAGASAANALARRGWQVEILDSEAATAAGATGNPAGVLIPRLSSDHDPASRISLAAYLLALHELDGLCDRGRDFDWRPCGALQLAQTDRERERQLRIGEALALPDSLLRRIDAAEACACSGVRLEHGGLLFPGAGWVAPRSLCESLLEDAGSSLRMRLATRVVKLEREDTQWLVLDTRDRVVTRGAVVIVAAGTGTPRIEPCGWLPLTPVRGQLTCASATRASESLKKILCYDGYVLPAARRQHVVGASFQPNDDDSGIRAKDHLDNLERLARAVPALSDLVRSSSLTGRAAVRAATLDHLPLIGGMVDAARFQRDYAELSKGRRAHTYPPVSYQPGLYVSAGHGSHGLTTGFLAAELIASLIDGEPLPLERDLVDCLNPSRFPVRDLKRETPR